jgi:Glucodextranase, domain B/S-layer homology domain
MLIFFSASHGAFSADELIVDSPKDKIITTRTRLMITGTAFTAKEVSVNRTKITPTAFGTFEAAALLRPGKNFVSVTATFPNGEAPVKNVRILRTISFDDIENYAGGKPHWSKTDVVRLATLGIIEGYPDNNFMPEQYITRGEIATWLARARGMKCPAPKSDVFYDVPKEHWRARYIKAVTDAGYMQGSSNDKFGIDTTVKRGEAVMMFVKAFGFKPPSNPAVYFPDVPKGSKYFLTISAAFTNGMVIGYPGKTKILAPEVDMKRAEAAMLISSLPNVRKQVTELYDFKSGYSEKVYSRIGTKPVITKAQILPVSLLPNGKTPSMLTVYITDSQGDADISMVWADLSSVNGPVNAKLTRKSAGVYELPFIVTSEAEAGERSVTIKALDKAGLESEERVKFSVTK